MRELVYGKYGGRCAYCGCELTLKEMQVDHANITIGSAYYGTHTEPARQAMADGTIDDIDNLMPSCRQCNFYKGMHDIEGFRKSLKDVLSATCRKSFQVRLAMKYDILTFTPWDGKFYFEKLNEQPK